MDLVESSNAGKADSVFSDLIEDDPSGVEWHTATETAKILRMISDINREKLDEAKLGPS